MIFYQLITITIIPSIHCYFVNHLPSTLFDQSTKIIWTSNCGYCYWNNHKQSILFLSYNVFMQHLCDQFNAQHIQLTYFDQLNCDIWNGWNLYCFCCMFKCLCLSLSCILVYYASWIACIFYLLADLNFHIFRCAT